MVWVYHVQSGVAAMKACSIGIRVHSGWGALVAVSGEPGTTQIIDRRHVEIIDRNLRGAAQPYHFAKELELSAGEKHVADSAATSARLALVAMRQVVDHLRSQDYKVVSAAILLSSGRPLPDFAKVLASHTMIHTAEGEFFRQAFRKACVSLKIPVTGIRERDLDNDATAAFGRASQSLKKRIAALGKTLRAPWTTDQKTAALAAAIVLARQSIT
jgi:hypothetical protein